MYLYVYVAFINDFLRKQFPSGKPIPHWAKEALNDAGIPLSADHVFSEAGSSSGGGGSNDGLDNNDD